MIDRDARTEKLIPNVEQDAIWYWFETGRIRFKPGSDGLTVQNLVVRARAGTGKTTTILEGVERAPEDKILLAAFNKAIATELQRRIRNPRVEAKTLHGLGFKFVMYNWKGVKVDEEGNRAKLLAQVATGGQAPDNVLKLVANLHTKVREINPFVKAPRDLQQYAVQFNMLPDDDMAEKGWDTEAVLGAAFKAMQLAKSRNLNGQEVNEIDFADMIFLPLANNWVRPWFNMVVIDEAQDMTVAQLELAKRCCKRGGRVCAVGDDRQAIYAFRGADSGSLDRLKKELSAEELGLTTTYRCGKAIVALAQTLVPDFKAAEGNGEGTITNITRDKMEEIAAPVDFILSRTNAPLAKVCMALLKRGVRAYIKGRDIGKGLSALIRKLKVGSIDQLDSKLMAWVEVETKRASDKLSEEAASQRIEFVQDQANLLIALAEGLATIGALEARITDLFADVADRPSVMCSTVHRAKGLEAPRVFLLEGTFRVKRTTFSTLVTEESNISYVGITRAKTNLYWVAGFETASKGGQDGAVSVKSMPKQTLAAALDSIDPGQQSGGDIDDKRLGLDIEKEQV